ncbi:hypothetical protein AXZ77_2668 [Thioclava sp. ES.031]|uniref:YMGG-like Gly-zipper domain-containing protein n=2 Tax=Thioclava TaxID=285107 RepID=A0ABX6YVC5_9RHOB|nr:MULTISPECIES: hypothetical protein [Thioclava]PFG64041.1 hypothetical protein AXZ77_2668 [Thioclava sp. ES.031]QPZ91807.1 hypothetical protein AKL02_013505 [Thioclava electrotropha]
MRIATILMAGGLLVSLAACGDNATERAATGGVGGLVVAGPVGAVAGATVGAATTK